jgi:hypothetical protein
MTWKHIVHSIQVKSKDQIFYFGLQCYVVHPSTWLILYEVVLQIVRALHWHTLSIHYQLDTRFPFHPEQVLQNSTNKYIKCECHFEFKFPNQLFEGFLQIFKSIHAQCSPSFTPNWPLICFFMPTLMLSIKCQKIITEHKNLTLDFLKGAKHNYFWTMSCPT